MAKNLTASKNTLLKSEEVAMKAVQFFSTEGKWRVTSQSSHSVTFEGKQRVPWFMMTLMLLGFLCCVIPGLVMYFMIVRKMNRFVNLVVTMSAVTEGTFVSVLYPSWASKLVTRFIDTLPTKSA